MQNPSEKHAPDSPEERSPQKPDRSRGGGIWPLLLIFLLAWLLARQMGGSSAFEIAYSDFWEQLRKDNVAEVVLRGESIDGAFRKKTPVSPASADDRTTGTTSVERFRTTRPPFEDPRLMETLRERGVDVVSEGAGSGAFWLVLANLLPLLLLLGLGFMLFRNARSQAGGLMSVGKSGAKQFKKEKTSVTFDDVAGVEEAKESLKEIIDFLKKPERFARLGCRIPKGVLLVGPPGTGKTLLARAVAGEADVPFFSITGSDFMEMFVGVGASRVRDLFRKARRNAPCIIFLDELDSVGRHRGAGLGGGHDEREQTLNQFLSEIDGFEPTENVVVMAATNRPDILDPALLRPGRFDRRVVVDLPSISERIEILKVHARETPLADDVDLESVARSMPGRSGADLRNLVNEAALIAAGRDRDRVAQKDFSEARDLIMMGQQRGGVELSKGERRGVAVHEAGHALVAHLTPDADPVEKVSVIPRGRALGATQQLPEERYNLTREYLQARLAVMLGGRAAEESALETISTGAADDLAQATKLARRMTAHWGMSEKFRNVAFEDGGQEVFLGEQISQQRSYSEETAREIDLEVREMIAQAYERSVEMLRRHEQRLHALADALEERETLEGEELEALLDGESPRNDDS